MTQGKTLADADEVFAKLAAVDAQRTDVRDLLRHILREFGGNPGLARALKECFDASNEGSQNQARILSDVMKLIDRESEHHEDYGEMSMDDLQRHAAALMHEMAGDTGSGPDSTETSLDAEPEGV